MASPHPRDRGGATSAVVDHVIQEVSQLPALKSLSAERLVEMASQMGDFLANHIRLNTSQIRKFLDAVNAIKSQSVQQVTDDAFFRSACMLLKPKLAYAAGRQPDEVKPLMAVLVPCIDRVHTKDDFGQFYRFVEAMVAYHRFYGGRD
jgi:CRISPR-associated protein Csm2